MGLDPTATTTQSGEHSPSAGNDAGAQLVLIGICDQLHTRSSRHLLDGVDEVRFGRGDREACAAARSCSCASPIRGCRATTAGWCARRRLGARRSRVEERRRRRRRADAPRGDRRRRGDRARPHVLRVPHRAGEVDAPPTCDDDRRPRRCRRSPRSTARSRRSSRARAHGPDGRLDPAARRDRHRQGARRARGARALGAAGAVRRGQLRRAAGRR